MAKYPARPGPLGRGPRSRWKDGLHPGPPPPPEVIRQATSRARARGPVGAERRTDRASHLPRGGPCPSRGVTGRQNRLPKRGTGDAGRLLGQLHHLSASPAGARAHPARPIYGPAKAPPQARDRGRGTPPRPTSSPFSLSRGGPVPIQQANPRIGKPPAHARPGDAETPPRDGRPQVRSPARCRGRETPTRWICRRGPPAPREPSEAAFSNEGRVRNPPPRAGVGTRHGDVRLPALRPRPSPPRGRWDAGGRAAVVRATPPFPPEVRPWGG